MNKRDYREEKRVDLWPRSRERPLTRKSFAISQSARLSDVNEFPAAVTNPRITKLARDLRLASDPDQPGGKKRSRTRVSERHKSRKIGLEPEARVGAKNRDGAVENGRLTFFPCLCLCVIRGEIANTSAIRPASIIRSFSGDLRRCSVWAMINTGLAAN